MKKYAIRLKDGDYLKSLSEYQNSSTKPIKFDTKEEAEIYALANDLEGYLIEEVD